MTNFRMKFLFDGKETDIKTIPENFNSAALEWNFDYLNNIGFSGALTGHTVRFVKSDNEYLQNIYKEHGKYAEVKVKLYQNKYQDNEEICIYDIDFEGCRFNNIYFECGLKINNLADKLKNLNSSVKEIIVKESELENLRCSKELTIGANFGLADETFNVFIKGYTKSPSLVFNKFTINNLPDRLRLNTASVNTNDVFNYMDEQNNPAYKPQMYSFVHVPKLADKHIYTKIRINITFDNKYYHYILKFTDGTTQHCGYKFILERYTTYRYNSGNKPHYVTYHELDREVNPKEPILTYEYPYNPESIIRQAYLEFTDFIQYNIDDQYTPMYNGLKPDYLEIGFRLIGEEQYYLTRSAIVHNMNVNYSIIDFLPTNYKGLKLSSLFEKLNEKYDLFRYIDFPTLFATIYVTSPAILNNIPNDNGEYRIKFSVADVLNDMFTLLQISQYHLKGSILFREIGELLAHASISIKDYYDLEYLYTENYSKILVGKDIDGYDNPYFNEKIYQQENVSDDKQLQLITKNIYCGHEIVQKIIEKDKSENLIFLAALSKNDLTPQSVGEAMFNLAFSNKRLVERNLQYFGGFFPSSVPIISPHNNTLNSKIGNESQINENSEITSWTKKFKHYKVKFKFKGEASHFLDLLNSLRILILNIDGVSTKILPVNIKVLSMSDTLECEGLIIN